MRGKITMLLKYCKWLVKAWYPHVFIRFGTFVNSSRNNVKQCKKKKQTENKTKQKSNQKKIKWKEMND